MQVYSQPGKVQSMLEALQREAVTTMLFLRSLERLEILEWHAGHAEPRALFECQIAASPQLRSARQLFARAASPQAVAQDVSGKFWGHAGGTGQGWQGPGLHVVQGQDFSGALQGWVGYSESPAGWQGCTWCSEGTHMVGSA